MTAELKWERKFEKAVTAHEALELVRGFFGDLRRNAKMPAANTRGFVYISQLCDRLIGKWPKARAALEARKLMHRCYLEIGEVEKARAIFLEYSNEVRKRVRAFALWQGANEHDAQSRAYEKTANLINNKGLQLFHNRDYVESAYYYSTVISNYPSTAAASRAYYMTGRIFSKSGRIQEAITAYKKGLEIAEDQYLLRSICRELSTEFCNAGREGEAVKVWEKMKRRVEDPRLDSYAMFMAGIVLYSEGEAFYPAAINKLKVAVESHPGNPYAKSAKKLIHRIQRDAVGDVQF